MEKVIKLFIGITLAAIGIAAILFNLAALNTAPWNTTASEVKSALGRGIPESNPGLRFAVISDIHIRSTDEKAQGKMQNALEDLLDPQKEPLDLIVVNGDLGDGLPDDYSTLNRIIRNARSGPAQKTPLVFTIGNHEFYKAYHLLSTSAWNTDTFPNGETDEQAVQRFLNFAGRDKVYTDRVIKGYHFIFLGSEKSAMSDRKIGDGVYLSEEQLSWLKNKLAENADPQKPIFLFLHQPVYTAKSDSPIHTQYVMQHEELTKILEAYPQVILFSGHLHLKLGAPGTVVHEVFTMFEDSSVSRVRQASADASEGLMVETEGSKVSVQGRDFELHKFLPDYKFTLNYGQ